jgi:fructose-bisphosphate aldolase class II
LNFARLTELKQALSVPLVLHGASSIDSGDLQEAIRLGIRKINVGSALKRAYFEAMRQAAAQAGDDYNPYDVIGSGLAGDVLTAGRTTLQKTVEEWMRLFRIGRKNP